MKQIVPSIIWAVSIAVWIVMVLGTIVLRSARALLVRLGRVAAGRPARTSSGEHGSHAGGCPGC
jgi:hypothetical protein